jgi:FkbM family methyltransferase
MTIFGYLALGELPFIDPIGQVQIDEVHLMYQLAKDMEIRTVFDVGANVGQWSRLAHNRFKDATIHAFEIVPQTFERLQENLVPYQRILAVPWGLSDKSYLEKIHYPESCSTVSSKVDFPFKNVESVLIECPVVTGDEYLESIGFPTVDFLKIDTDGMEMEVFHGFEKSLKAGKLPLIQFEYARYAIYNHNLLADFYALLMPLGYKIGRLTRLGIGIKPYECEDEDFGAKGVNFVAVHEQLWPKMGLK